MKEDRKNYETFLVKSISKVDESNKYYVFDVIPPKSYIIDSYDDDFYYELVIKTTDSPIYYNNFFSNYIHIKFLDDNTLEIYEGEYIEECFSDGPVKYEKFELKKIEKEYKFEYKNEYTTLKFIFEDLLNKKLAIYELQRNNIEKQYQNIYDESKSSLWLFGLDEKNNPSPLLNYIYYLFQGNPSVDSLNKKIDSNYYNNWKQIKSWKDDYLNLKMKFENLKDFDVANYEIVKNHIIELYKEAYYRGLQLYKNINVANHDKYFNYLIKKLKET